jgi:hypothetical protein
MSGEESLDFAVILMQVKGSGPGTWVTQRT